MRIAIMGTGGIGAYYGACLARAGVDVVFVARGAHLDAMRRNGLRIEDFGGGEFIIDPVNVTDDPQSVGPVDAVLFCVKMYDTIEAATLCLPLIGDKTCILTLQNGVESVAMIDSVVGAGRTLGGAAYVAGSITAPGVVKRNNQITKIEFGESDGGISARARALATLLEGAGIEAIITPDARAMLWTKFVLMTSNACMTALSRCDTGTIKTDPVMRDVYCSAMRETITLGRALGVNLPADIEDRTLDWLDSSAPIMASLAVDLINGRRLEVEWLSGAIHRLGIDAGVPTPIHTTAYAALRPHREGAAGGQ
ncbi:MAG: 2-dehydropantoate 2-reductase [Rhodospirillales bacterium]|nr:2-dehydropantoate 2-reductase [Rhodospirillales bacterium]